MIPDHVYEPIRRCWHFWRFRLEFTVSGKSYQCCAKCLAKAHIKLWEPSRE